MIPTIRVQASEQDGRQPCSQGGSGQDSLVQAQFISPVMGRLVLCPLGASVSSAASYGDPWQLAHSTAKGEHVGLSWGAETVWWALASISSRPS